LYCGQLFGSSVPGSAAMAIVAALNQQATPKPAANDALRIAASPPRSSLKAVRTR
jgi:hypothetical protein